jgi:hypothetical protein
MLISSPDKPILRLEDLLPRFVELVVLLLRLGLGFVAVVDSGLGFVGDCYLLLGWRAGCR